MNNKKLPNFICVGAQKAGSSSLYKLLQSHPEIYLSEKKEIHYFNIETEYTKGLGYYASFFNENYNNQKLIGECTPDYLQYTFVPERIRNDLGKIKILIILRHPVDRAYSQFNFHKMLRVEKSNTDFKISIDQEPVNKNINERLEWYKPAYYKSKSLYFDQVKRYYDCFGKNNVHIIVFEKMITNKKAANLKDTCRFLDVDANHIFQSDHSNRTILNYESYKAKILRSLRDISLKIVPNQVIDPLKNYTKKKLYKMPSKLDAKLKSELFDNYFSEDVKKLENLIQQDLSIWR